MRAEMELGADLRAPYLARRWVASLRPPLSTDRSDRLEWLVAELVTASVKHAMQAGRHGSLDLSFLAEDGVVRVEVTDPGRSRPPVVPEEPDDVTGFGFYLLDRMADRWGFTEGPLPGLWFEMDVYGLSASG
ncbi:MAG TPA: ATP-binding protein [Actinomycetota bacterium]